MLQKIKLCVAPAQCILPRRCAVDRLTCAIMPNIPIIIIKISFLNLCCLKTFVLLCCLTPIGWKLTELRTVESDSFFYFFFGFLLSQNKQTDNVSGESELATAEEWSAKNGIALKWIQIGMRNCQLKLRPLNAIVIVFPERRWTRKVETTRQGKNERKKRTFGARQRNQMFHIHGKLQRIKMKRFKLKSFHSTEKLLANSLFHAVYVPNIAKRFFSF